MNNEQTTDNAPAVLASTDPTAETAGVPPIDDWKSKYTDLQRVLAKKDKRVKELESSQWAMTQGLANMNRAAETSDKILEVLSGLSVLEEGERANVKQIRENQKATGRLENELLTRGAAIQSIITGADDFENGWDSPEFSAARAFWSSGQYAEAEAETRRVVTSGKRPSALVDNVEALVEEVTKRMTLKEQLKGVRGSDDSVVKPKTSELESLLAQIQDRTTRNDPEKRKAIIARLAQLSS